MTTENMVGHDIVALDALDALDARVVRATISVVSQVGPADLDPPDTMR